MGKYFDKINTPYTLVYTHGTKMADLAHCHAMTKVVHPRVHIYTPPHTRGGSQASSQAVTALRRLSAARGRKLVLRQYFPDWCCSSENLGYSDIYGGFSSIEMAGNTVKWRI